MAKEDKQLGRFVMQKLVVSEATHSVFYAPLYVAMQKGYFKAYGLSVSLRNAMGSDKVMEDVLGAVAEIGLMGPETTLYLYNKHTKERVINFAKLTSRAGNFLISREQEKNFKWKDVKECTILGDRNDGIPETVLEYILRRNRINPDYDVNIIQSISFGKTAQAFVKGKGDYTIEFEPDVTKLEHYGYYTIASLGIDSGYIPYTSFCADAEFIKKYPGVIQSFTNALQEGMRFVNTHLSKQTAKVIAPLFSGIPFSDLVHMVRRYQKQGTWDKNLIFDKSSYDLLEEVLISDKRLERHVPYRYVVNTEFARKAMRKIKR